MAVEQVAVHQLPFTIEPLAPKRVQLWSRFAGRAVSLADMWIVRTVYYAFWWELRVEETVQRVFVCHQSLYSQAEAGHLVGWLENLAYELVTLRDAYSEIATRIAACSESYARQYKDVDERFLVVLSVLDVVREYGVMLCSQWGLVVPEHLLPESVSPTVSAAGEGAESL